MHYYAICQLLKILSIFFSPPEAKQCSKACAVAIPAVTSTCMLALEQTWFWQLTAYLQPLPNAQSRSWNMGKRGECTARHVGWGLSHVLRLLLTLVDFKHLPLLSMTNWMHYPSSWEKASGGLNESVAAYHIYFSLCQCHLVFFLIIYRVQPRLVCCSHYAHDVTWTLLMGIFCSMVTGKFLHP